MITMKKLFYFFCLLSIHTSAQDIVIPRNRIPVQQDGFFAWVQVFDGNIKASSVENNKTYFWLKAKQVHASKGGYAGELLDGEYLALYKTDALKEKGHYNKGLKNGEWKEWYLDGELKLISHWKNGLQKGAFIYYNEKGKVVQKHWYRNGALHGKQYSYTDSTETFVRYRKGHLVKPKIRTKKRKIKMEKANVVPADNDSLLISPKEKKHWFGKHGQNKERTDSLEIPKKTRTEQPAEKEKQPSDRKKPKKQKHEKDHPVQEQNQREQRNENKQLRKTEKS